MVLYESELDKLDAKESAIAPFHIYILHSIDLAYVTCDISVLFLCSIFVTTMFLFMNGLRCRGWSWIHSILSLLKLSVGVHVYACLSVLMVRVICKSAVPPLGLLE